MKNGIIYKVMATLLAVVLISSISFGQSKKKEIKKEKRIMITMEIDEDGNTTTIDSIVMYDSDHDFDIDVDVDEIMLEVKHALSESHESLKEMKIEIIADMKDGEGIFCKELSEQKKEVKQALKDLQKELKSLEIEDEARERIQVAMDKLKEVDWKERAINMNHFIFDENERHFGDEEYETIEFIIEDGDTTEVKTKVLWVGDEHDGHGHHDKNVWVTNEGNKKIIIKTTGDGEHDENVFFIHEDDDHHNKAKNVKVMKFSGDSDVHMLMLKSASEKDIEKAQAAGLDIDEDNRLEINNINVEIDDNDAIIKLKSEEDGKMKVQFLDENFKKIKQVKTKEEHGTHQFPLNLKGMKSDGAKYLLIEQNKKKELMKL